MSRLAPKFRLRRGVFAVGLCLALSACENPWLDDAPSLETLLSKGWLFGDRGGAAAASNVRQPVYCYETIGVGDCYDQPLEGGGNRLVGFSGPPPQTDLPRPAQ